MGAFLNCTAKVRQYDILKTIGVQFIPAGLLFYPPVSGSSIFATL